MGVISAPVQSGRSTWTPARPDDFHKGKSFMNPEEHMPSYSSITAFYVSHLPRSTSRASDQEDDDFNRFITELAKNHGSRPALNTSSCDCWQRPHLLHSRNSEKSLHLRHKRPIEGRDETSEHVKYLGAIVHAGLYKRRAGFGRALV